MKTALRTVSSFGTTVLLAFILSVANNPALAQINTEAMRKGELQPGIHADLSLDAGVIMGNSRLLRIRTTFRIDHLRNGIHNFLVSSFQQGRQGQNDSLFINKGIIHFRRTWSLDKNLSIEGFLQKEFNDFIRLRDRNLAGSGLRIRLLESKNSENNESILTIYAGLGLMWEREQIKDIQNTTTDLMRSTNYFVLKWEPDDRILVQTTTYFQLDLRRFSDHRMLSDTGLTFNLSGKLAVIIKLNMRYDNEPPTDVKYFDLELTNGLSYQF